MRFVKIENGLVPEQLLEPSKRSKSVRIFDLGERPPATPNPNFPFSRELQTFLSGRILLLEEIPFPLEEIHRHAENGYIEYKPGLTQDKHGFLCYRCGNQQQRLFASYLCSRCGEECVYCRKCIMMGRISQCTPLIYWTGPVPAFSIENALAWEGVLSPAQAEAAAKIKEAVAEKKDLLVWAVCGAGKTEMLFEGIAYGLEAGKRICIATPRTDVVLELAPRFQKAFPTVDVAALYGGSEDRYRYAPLTVATTHQLIRFDKAFDVMIIDEVDAFPYTADEMLQHAGEKARKQESALIFLTATPKQEWQRECFRGKRNCFILPARYHRHPLPIPQFRWCGNWRKELAKGRIPGVVSTWTKRRLQQKKQALIFFPHIELMERALPLFQKLDSRIDAVHSEDPARKEKVQKMRDKQTPILLTTTILERGVTFPNIDVAVVGAEDEVFTESALVQIAGRVGRSPDFPTGEIVFFHYGKTDAMIRAKNQLLRMNMEAKRRGLVD